jgi:hypothetical protein
MFLKEIYVVSPCHVLSQAILKNKAPRVDGISLVNREEHPIQLVSLKLLPVFLLPRNEILAWKGECRGQSGVAGLLVETLLPAHRHVSKVRFLTFTCPGGPRFFLIARFELEIVRNAKF